MYKSILINTYSINILRTWDVGSAFLLARNWVVAAVATYRWELICVPVPQRATSRIFGGVRCATLLWLAFVALSIVACAPRLQERFLKVERMCAAGADAAAAASESELVASPTAASLPAIVSPPRGTDTSLHAGLVHTTGAADRHWSGGLEEEAAAVEYEVLGLSPQRFVRGTTAYALWVAHHKVFLFVAQTGLPLFLVVFMNARIVYRLLHSEQDFNSAFDDTGSMSSYQRIQRYIRSITN